MEPRMVKDRPWNIGSIRRELETWNRHRIELKTKKHRRENLESGMSESLHSLDLETRLNGRSARKEFGQRRMNGNRTSPSKFCLYPDCLFSLMY